MVKQLTQYWDRVSVHLLLLMVFLTPLFFIPNLKIENPAVNEKWLLVGLLCFILIMVSLLRWVTTRELPWEHTVIHYALSVFAVGVVVSALLSSNWRFSLGESVPQLALLGVVLVSTVRVRREEGEKLLLMAVAAGILVALYGLFQYFGFAFLRPLLPLVIPSETGRYFVYSTIGNPEYLGSYLAPLVVVLLPFFWQAHSVWWHGLRLLILVLLVTVIFLTGARGAFIGLLVSAVFVVISLVKTRRLLITRGKVLAAVLLFLVIMVIMMVFSYPNAINRRNVEVIQRFQALVNLRSYSVRERLIFYTLGATMFQQRPLLGVGPGMFKVHFYPLLSEFAQGERSTMAELMALDLKSRVPANAHNDLLQILVEQGIVGWMSFSLLVLTLFWWSGRGLFRAQVLKDKEYGVLLALNAALLCLLVNSSFSFPLHTPTRASLFWLLFLFNYRFCLHVFGLAKQQDKEMQR